MGYAVAEDNLRLGLTVVADSVNPLGLTRDAWVAAANRVKCSDTEEHRRRVERRTNDISGLRLPAWSDVAGREYQAWERDHIAIDTGCRSVEECVRTVLEAMGEA